MKKISLLRIAGSAAALVAVMLAPSLAFAGDKSDICHVTGNGGYQLINVSNRALTAHLDHGDALPGAILSEGTPYPGVFGGTVTPITLLGGDCSTSEVLRTDITQNFQQGQGPGVSAGWAGWSCVELGYPSVVGGGITPEDGTTIAQGAAKAGAAAVDGNSYPTYPHYTFTPPEEGWVVHAAGETPPTGIYVLCGE